MKEYRLKVEIAQLSLSDLGREVHARRIPLALWHSFTKRCCRRRCSESYTLCGEGGCPLHGG